MDKIFISYSRLDKEKVYPFVAEIEKRIGQKCWIDLNGIESSDEFVEKIIRAINKAEIVIFMHSKRSAKAPYVRKEIQFAFNKNKRVILVLIDDTPIDDYFLFQFGTLNYINYTKTEEKEKLFKDLRSWLGLPMAHMPKPSIFSKPSIKNSSTQSITPTKKHKVGDKIVINGTTGTVFKITDDGKHGKAVSCKESTASWCVKNDLDIDTGALSFSDGKENTLKIQEMPLWKERFPAFSWCKSLGEDWYLPAIEEVEQFTQKHFHNNSYDIERYWSSTEKDQQTAYYQFITGGYPYPGSKVRNRYVRAVAVF